MPVTRAQLKQTGRIRLEYTNNNMKPRTDSVKTISSLKSKGYKIGLVSDCTVETPRVWEKTPFAPLFDITVFSCLAGMKKPDPRIYKLAVEKLSVKPADCLYIGDGDGNELGGAAEVGMHPVLILDPGEESANVIRDNPLEAWKGPVISSLKEVFVLLKD